MFKEKESNTMRWHPLFRSLFDEEQAMRFLYWQGCGAIPQWILLKGPAKSTRLLNYHHTSSVIHCFGKTLQIVMLQKS